jgi:Mrp family chromosome partitioning ATPase
LDGDFLRPLIAPAMGLRGAAGIAELLNGSASLSHALVKDPRSNAFVLSVARPAGPALWASPNMGNLLGYLKQHCDLVIIDAMPVLQAPEMSVLARMCDQIVLVTQGRAPQAGLEAAAHVLARHGAAAPSLVITR